MCSWKEMMQRALEEMHKPWSIPFKVDILTWTGGNLRRFQVHIKVENGEMWELNLSLNLCCVVLPPAPLNGELFLPLDLSLIQFGRWIELDCHSVFSLWNSFCKCMCYISLNSTQGRIITQLINLIGAFHSQPVRLPDINVFFLTSLCKLKDLCYLLVDWWRIEAQRL